ncbi:hypothetical protein RCL1_000521 [Eukaryota sp. TZLM3-RCL]
MYTSNSPPPGSNCQYNLCGVHDFLATKCEYCLLVLCPRHHSISSHSCPNAPKPTTTTPSNTVTPINNAKCQNCKNMVMSVTLITCEKCRKILCLSCRHTDAHKCKKVSIPTPHHYVGKMPDKVAKRKRKQSAVGMKSIEPINRVYLDVQGTISSQLPKCFFFTKGTTIGRSIDIISQHLGLNSSSASLQMILTSDGSIISKGKSLNQFEMETIDVILDHV